MVTVTAKISNYQLLLLLHNRSITELLVLRNTCVCWWCSRIGAFSTAKKVWFSKLSKLPRSTMWKWTSTSRSMLVYFHIVESWKVGKLGKYAPAVATRYTVLSRFTATENKDRSAQSVQDEASLSPAATRAGFSSAPRPQISITRGIRSVTLGHD